MCKFHKEIARDIATSCCGTFDPGAYAVALTAMAHFRIEQYVPELFGCDGFVPAKMAGADAQRALTAAGLEEDSSVAERFRSKHLKTLQAAMRATRAAHDLSPAALQIAPGELTAQGYKATPQAQPDPTVNGPFLDHAVVHLFTGYDDDAKTYVSKGRSLSLVARAEHDRFEPIRAATADLWAQPQVAEIMRTMFQHALVRIIRAAPEDLQAARGFAATKGCVMCHDDDRRTAHAKGPRPQ